MRIGGNQTSFATLRQQRRRFVVTGAALVTGLAAMRNADGANTPDAAADAGLPFLRGVNFGGLTHEAWSQPPPPAAADYFVRQKRMNVVRLNFTWEYIQPRLGGPLDEPSCREIDAQIARVAAAGGYTILELHNYGRRTVDGVTHIIGESPVVTAAAFADGWGRIAQRWQDHSKVIFALMNEPHDQDTEVLVRVSNAAIGAIRRAGARQLVMVSGNGWNSMGWTSGSDNRKWMLHIKDPGNRFCFDVHHYFDDYSRGQSPNVRDDPVASMEAFTEWARAHGKRGFCGEFACHVNRRGLDAARALLLHIESNRDVYLGWAWWGAGGPWQPDYIYLLDPFASVSSRTNPDPSGSRDWARPVDRPQMKLLQEFLPSSATPFNAWLIEANLGPALLGSYRRGDYHANSAGAFWVDAGPRRAIARPLASVLPVDADGWVVIDNARQILGINVPQRSCNAMAFVRTPSPTSGAPTIRPALLSTTQDCRYVSSGVGRGLDRLGLSLVRPDEIGSADVSASPANQSVLRIATESSRNGARNAGRVSDIVLLQEGVSDADISRVEARLSWDAGLAHLLPDGHPYRSRAPSSNNT